mmetsp:Transcript_116287/g.182950  ORF Transcript_116287/g.182950 Transcript_116287/m.182950 type:complete len:143 (+) Transcript_116287:790-1218(+)
MQQSSIGSCSPNGVPLLGRGLATKKIYIHNTSRLHPLHNNALLCFECTLRLQWNLVQERVGIEMTSAVVFNVFGLRRVKVSEGRMRLKRYVDTAYLSSAVSSSRRFASDAHRRSDFWHTFSHTSKTVPKTAPVPCFRVVMVS